MASQTLDLAKMLDLYPTCQKRTGKNKQYTFMVGDHIIKGPYKQEKVDRIRSVSEQMKKWSEQLKFDLLIHPLEQQYISPEGIFITYPNMAKDYPVTCEWITESFTGVKHAVINRNTVMKLNDVIEGNWNWISSYIPYIIITFCELYSLNVGDTGLHNILADVEKQKIYIIDYEDKRGGTNPGDFFYFTKNPRKSIVEYWLQYAKPYYEHISQSLKSIGLNEIADYLHPVNSDRDANTIIIRTGSPIPPSKNHSPIDSTVANYLQDTVTPSINPGKMLYKGMFGGSITYSGFAIDAMKSAIQKYIRRGESTKAILSGIEMYRMVEVGGSNIQSNMYNRLAVIAAEDVGPANIPLVIDVINTILSGNRDIYKLAAMIQMLSGSNKTRIMSHLYRAYIHPEGREVAKSKNIVVDDNYDNELYISSATMLGNLFLVGDPEQIKPYIIMFNAYLRQKDRKALIWLNYYMIASKDLKIAKRRRRTDPMLIIWDIIGYYLINWIREPLEKAYFKMSEKRPFLMMAMTCILFDKGHSSGEQSEKLDSGLQHGTQVWQQHQATLSTFMQGNYNLQLDDYVYDMHTKEGKKKGADRSKFVNEGSVVNNQDEELYDELLFEIYKT